MFSLSKVRFYKIKLELVQGVGNRFFQTKLNFRTLTIVIKIFQTNLNLVWNLRPAMSFFFFPNQTEIGLENRTQFLGVTFPNQIGFGLEKDTE